MWSIFLFAISGIKRRRIWFLTNYFLRYLSYHFLEKHLRAVYSALSINVQRFNKMSREEEEAKKAKSYYDKIMSCPGVEETFYVFLLSFIVAAAICQGMPAMYQGGLDATSEKYKLYFNYLCPELRRAILQNGDNWANIGISSAGSLTFAGLALTGLKELITKQPRAEVIKSASIMSKIYRISASVPGAFLTVKFFPGLFDSWPFNGMELGDAGITGVAYGAGGAVLVSNLMMYGNTIGDDVLKHFGDCWHTMKTDPNLVKRLVMPLLLIYTYYTATLQQMSGLNAELKDQMGKVMPESVTPYVTATLSAIPSAAFAAFIHGNQLVIAEALYRRFIMKVYGAKDGHVKEAFKLILHPVNVIKFLINIIMLLPMMAMFMEFMGGAVEMTYSESMANTTIDSIPLNIANVQAPSLQCAIVCAYLANDIPGTLWALGKRICGKRSEDVPSTSSERAALINRATDSPA